MAEEKGDSPPKHKCFSDDHASCEASLSRLAGIKKYQFSWEPQHLSRHMA